MKTFYWNPETVQYFSDLKRTGTLKEFERELWYFISHDTQPEENETYRDLYIDLLYQVNKFENETF